MNTGISEALFCARLLLVSILLALGLLFLLAVPFVVILIVMKGNI